MWPPEDGKREHQQTREYARKACEGALQRLRSGYIDLFTLRGPIDANVDIAEVMQELKVDLLPVCRELGIGVLAYSPLGRGILTGQLRDLAQLDPTDFRRTASPWFDEGNLQKNLELVAAVERLAAQKCCTPGQLAIAWLLAKSPDVIPIPGTKRIAALEENAAAATVQLTHEEVEQLEKLVPVGAVVGD
eukprot:gene921-1248_t